MRGFGWRSSGSPVDGLCTRKQKGPPPARDSKKRSCHPRRTCLVMPRFNTSDRWGFLGDWDGTVSGDVLSRLAKGDHVDVRLKGTDRFLVVDRVYLETNTAVLLLDGNRVTCDFKQIHMVHPAKMTEWHLKQLDVAIGWMDRIRTKTVHLNAERLRVLEIRMKDFAQVPDLEERLERNVDDLLKREFERGETYGKIAAFFESSMHNFEGVCADGCVLYTPPDDLKRAIHARWCVRALRTGTYIAMEEMVVSKILTLRPVRPTTPALSLIHI